MVEMILTVEQREVLDNAQLCSGFLSTSDWKFIAGINARRNMFRFRHIELTHPQHIWLMDIHHRLVNVGVGNRYKDQSARASTS